jgi:hypothetical protein
METRIELPLQSETVDQELQSFQLSSAAPTTKQTIPARGRTRKWSQRDDSFVSNQQISINQVCRHHLDWLRTAPISNSITAITLNGRNDPTQKIAERPVRRHKTVHFFR